MQASSGAMFSFTLAPLAASGCAKQASVRRVDPRGEVEYNVALGWSRDRRVDLVLR